MQTVNSNSWTGIDTNPQAVLKSVGKTLKSAKRTITNAWDESVYIAKQDNRFQLLGQKISNAWHDQSVFMVSRDLDVTVSSYANGKHTATLKLTSTTGLEKEITFDLNLDKNGAATLGQLKGTPVSQGETFLARAFNVAAGGRPVVKRQATIHLSDIPVEGAALRLKELRKTTFAAKIPHEANKKNWDMSQLIIKYNPYKFDAPIRKLQNYMPRLVPN